MVRNLFECASIQFPDDVNRVYQIVIALLGGKGEMNKLGKVFAETGVTGQEDIPIAAFFEPLKRAEVCQRASELTLVELLPQGRLRQGRLFRPVQKQIGGLKH